MAETGRRDKASLIKARINDAIIRLSQYYTFKYDLQYVEYAIPAADQNLYIHLIPYASIPRYRKAESIQGASDILPLNKVNAAQATCRGVARKGTYYESALGLHISLHNLTSMVKVSYWANPERLVLDTDTCWHLDHAYHIIKDLASAYVYRSIGDTSEYDRLIGITQLQMLEFRNDAGGL